MQYAPFGCMLHISISYSIRGYEIMCTPFVGTHMYLIKKNEDASTVQHGVGPKKERTFKIFLWDWRAQ